MQYLYREVSYLLFNPCRILYHLLDLPLHLEVLDQDQSDHLLLDPVELVQHLLGLKPELLETADRVHRQKVEFVVSWIEQSRLLLVNASQDQHLLLKLKGVRVGKMLHQDCRRQAVFHTKTPVGQVLQDLLLD